MKTMKNRVSALFVALVMMLSLLSVGAIAWEKDEGIDVYWNGEKAGTVTYDVMEEHAKGYPAETYSNNKGEYTGIVYQFSKLLKTVNKNDDYKAAPDDTKVVITDAGKEPKPAEFTKAELEETRNYYDKDGKATAVKPGFMHVDGEDYFRFVFGQKTPDDSTSGRWTKLSGTGNAKLEITTPAEDPAPAEEEKTTGFEVFWNDKSVGTVTYKDIYVDGVSQATSTVTYSALNKSNTRTEETGYVFDFTRFLRALNKEDDWNAASDITTVVFETDKPAEFTKKELTETRYYYDENGTPVDKVKPGFLTEKKDGTTPYKFVFGQKEATEVNKNRFSSFDFDSLTQVRINTPILDIVDSDGTTTELLFADLQKLWNEEGVEGVGQKYTYTSSNTYPTFAPEEYYGPTLKSVLAKAGIDLDKLADTDVIRFDSSDGKGVDITVKDIKATRYTFPNGKSGNDYKGTTEAQLKEKEEVPFILSITNGQTNVRNIFGQIDPQEQQKSYFIKYLNKITVKKDAAREFTGLKPTIADGAKVKKGDKLNFDLELPTGVYEGAIYYTVSTDGTEPADPSYSDTMYNWAQNRTDDKDYLDPAKAKYYNIYEFTDAEKTIVKVKVYVSGYTEPKAMTLTYTGAPELNGVVKGPDGKWAYYKNDVLQKNYTGFQKNDYGWWRIKDGYVDFDADEIYKNPDNGVWYKATGGKVTFDETGVFKNDYGWWRVEKSEVDFDAQGIYRNDYGWWKTTDGKVTFDETGIYKNEYGWWRVEKSKVNFNANSIYRNDYGWWKTTKGKVTFKENGLFSNEYGTWKVENSKVNFKYNGTYQGKVIKGGKVV